MRRILSRHIRNSFCTESTKSENVKPEFSLNSEVESNYKKALQLRNMKRFKEANQYLNNILETIKKEQVLSTNLMIEIMKKEAANYNDLYQYLQSEKILEDIVKTILAKQTNPLLLYGAYSDLVNHCLRTNLTRGVKLAKALLSGRHKVELPMNYRKTFTLYLGTGYLLMSNYTDAKIKLEECINEDPASNIKGCAFNNLGIACWWHKHPRFNELTKPERDSGQQSTQKQANQQTEYDQIDRDFSNSLRYFKQSIESFEEVDNMVPGDGKDSLQKLLGGDMSQFIRQNLTSDKLLIKNNKSSGVPLLNITQFLLTNHFSKIQPIFWLKQSAMFYEQIDPMYNHRALILMAVMESAQGNFKEAEKMLKQVIRDLEETDNYLLVMAVELYSKILVNSDHSRSKQAEEFFSHGKLLAKSMLPWSNKLSYVALPKLSF